MGKPIRVLIVDDSATVRRILTEALSGAADIEVVGSAPDPYVAREQVIALKPDVVTLDIEMPRMDGLTFLKKLLEYKPIPVIMISSLGKASCEVAMEALRLGAVEVLAKPHGPYSVGELARTLADKVRSAAGAAVHVAGSQPGRVMLEKPLNATRRIVTIGASTGGPQTLTEILRELPAEMPPILITQHMPPCFTAHLAERLNKVCAFEVKEAADGEMVRTGLALVAPGGLHMRLERGAAGLRVRVSDGPEVCFSKPSVDVLFSSVAQVSGAEAVGVLLTGMGVDGARGMLAMRGSGAHTIAQDEASSIVYGMPREAARIGAAIEVCSREQMAQAVLRSLAA